jgi:hypothetical protein
MLMGMRARMAMVRMRMRRKEHRKLMIDQHRMWRTEGIVGLTWKQVMSTGMRARMATMQMQMRRNKYHKPTMDQRRMSRTVSIVPECVNIELKISDQ